MQEKRTDKQYAPAQPDQSPGASLPIGELLLKEGYIKKKELERALDIQNSEKEFSVFSV